MGSLTNQIVNLTINKLSDLSLDIQDRVKNTLTLILNEYNISEKSKELANITDDKKTKALQMFFVAKKVKGCTNNTLAYYSTVLRNFFDIVNTELERISADDIRLYIATRSINDNLSKISQDNERRVLRSFFGYCTAEGYIPQNPILSVDKIKTEKRIKKPFSEIEMEQIREHCKTLRDKAIIEVLYSTGVRVSELSAMNKEDLAQNEITVFGKCEKERVVFLNAKAQLALKNYLESRNDNNTAMFVGIKKPFERVSKGGIESIIKNIGKHAGVDKCHPHRFRRTTATYALNRGMPIEQVSIMLGHEKLETTTIYARSSIENVKSSHKKYIV